MEQKAIVHPSGTPGGQKQNIDITKSCADAIRARAA